MSIEDVMKRAGASDTDYENWLAERRNGLTATEVKHLYVEQVFDVGQGARTSHCC